jgi:hypothetical protein
MLLEMKLTCLNEFFNVSIIENQLNSLTVSQDSQINIE